MEYVGEKKRILLRVLNSIFRLTVVSSIVLYCSGVYAGEWPQYDSNPFIIPLANEQHDISGRGGIIVADLNNDSFPDYIISTKEKDFGDDARATIGAYDHMGDVLWTRDNVDIVLNGKAEDYGLPGWQGPGIESGDVDADGWAEVVYLTTKNQLVILNGRTGNEKKRISLPLPPLTAKVRASYGIFMNEVVASGFKSSKKKVMKPFEETPQRWSHFQLVNLRGTGDTDVIVQGEPFPYRWIKAISLTSEKELWQVWGYLGCKHNGFRAVDIDGDGFDEVLGGNIVEEDGFIPSKWAYRSIKGHLDALCAKDIIPDKSGIEWVVTEENHSSDGDRTALLSKDAVIFYHSHDGEEPQNIAVGEFDLSRPGLEIWCRSRFNTDQRPWVIDAQGNTIAEYAINERKPAEWSDEGIETMVAVDWDGTERNLIAAKERHTDGDIVLLDAMTGEFVQWWPESAARLYVVDVSGDYREELVVVNSEKNEIHIYWNDKENPQTKERYWNKNYYKRQKMNYNYYST